MNEEMALLCKAWDLRRVREAVLVLGLCGGLASCGDGESGNQSNPKAVDRIAGVPTADDPQESDPGVPIGKFSGADLSRLASNPGGVSAALGFPSAEVEARSFRRLSEEDRAAAAALVAQFLETDDLEARKRILDEIEAYYGEAVIRVVAEALRSPDESLREQAVNLLRGNISPQILEVLAPALADESAYVRIAAIEAVTQVREPAVVDFVARGFMDEDSSVRQATLIATGNLMEDNKIAALDQAMKSPYQDIISLALGELQVIGTRQALETVFQGIDSVDPGVREESRFAVSWLIDENFETAAEARAWWAEHKNEFTAELEPVNP